VLNKALLIGRLTKDPVIRYLPSGTPVTEFSLVWNRRFKVNDEWKEESHFFDIKAFGNLAESLATRLSKGFLVVVEGRLTQERWTAQDGKSQTKVRIIAESVRILRKPQTGEMIEETVPPDNEEQIEEELKNLSKEPPFDEEDEIPF